MDGRAGPGSSGAATRMSSGGQQLSSGHRGRGSEWPVGAKCDNACTPVNERRKGDKGYKDVETVVVIESGGEAGNAIPVVGPARGAVDTSLYVLEEVN